MNKHENSFNSLVEYRTKHSKKYNDIFNYALKNWSNLSQRADTTIYGTDGVVSIADQLQAYTNCPYVVASEIANSISISKAIGV